VAVFTGTGVHPGCRKLFEAGEALKRAGKEIDPDPAIIGRMAGD